jgi:hypothetical protein
MSGRRARDSSEAASTARVATSCSWGSSSKARAVMKMAMVKPMPFRGAALPIAAQSRPGPACGPGPGARRVRQAAHR